MLGCAVVEAPTVFWDSTRWRGVVGSLPKVPNVVGTVAAPWGGGYGSRPVAGGPSSGAGATDERCRGAVAAPADDATPRGVVGVFGSGAAGGSGSGAARGLGRGAFRERGSGADGVGWRGAACAGGRGADGGGWRGADGGGGRGAAGAMVCGAAGTSRRGAGSVAEREKLSCGGADMGGERRLGRDRSPGCGLRTQYEGNEDFDEDWSPREWIMRPRARFDKSRLTAPEFVVDSGEGERSLANMAGGSLNFHPSVLNGASFVGAFTRVEEGETLDEPGDDYDLGDGDDFGSEDDSEGGSASEDVEDEDARDRRDFPFREKADFSSRVKMD